jgi:hypothetical protein
MAPAEVKGVSAAIADIRRRRLRRPQRRLMIESIERAATCDVPDAP